MCTISCIVYVRVVHVYLCPIEANRIIFGKCTCTHTRQLRNAPGCYYFLRLPSLLTTKFVVSMKRSTQLVRHCSVRESVVVVILSTHRSQHRSVNVCTLVWNRALCISSATKRCISGSSSPWGCSMAASWEYEGLGERRS